MASLSRNLRLGAGLAGLGYGVYRLVKGRNDWVTTTLMTTGLSVALNAMTGRRVEMGGLASLANAVTATMPEVTRTAAHVARRSAPEAFVNAGWMPSGD